MKNFTKQPWGAGYGMILSLERKRLKIRSSRQPEQ